MEKGPTGSGKALFGRNQFNAAGTLGKIAACAGKQKGKKIGALESKSIDFRLICASNENLESLVQNGSFRSDLFYRINVVPVHVPPLHERKEDIAPLAFFFLQHFCKKYSRMKVLTENVITSMLSYDWPGNVRELKNFIERLVVTSPDTDLQIETLPKRFLEDNYNKHEDNFNNHASIFHTDPPAQTSHRSIKSGFIKRLSKNANMAYRLFFLL